MSKDISKLTIKQLDNERRRLYVELRAVQDERERKYRAEIDLTKKYKVGQFLSSTLRYNESQSTVYRISKVCKDYLVVDCLHVFRAGCRVDLKLRLAYYALDEMRVLRPATIAKYLKTYRKSVARVNQIFFS